RYVRREAGQEPAPNGYTDNGQLNDGDQKRDPAVEDGTDGTGDATDGTNDSGTGTPADEIDRELLYDENGIIKPEYAEKIIKKTADKVIQALKARDAQAISDFVH